jgi:hypothetical protein
MLTKYAAVLLAATLSGPALAQTRAPITSSPTSTGGGSVGYNESLVSSFAQAPSRPAPTSISARPAPKPASTRSIPNLTSGAASTAGGSSGYNQNLRPQ